MYLTTAAKIPFMELNELMELRDDAYKNTQIYKERTKKWHDSRLRGDKDFKDLGSKEYQQILVENLQIWRSRSVRVLKLQGGCSTQNLAPLNSTRRIYR
ncbi:hypothetical protein Tco_0863967, partial [Tanacetum coccineum]